MNTETILDALSFFFFFFLLLLSLFTLSPAYSVSVLWWKKTEVLS